MVKSPIIGLLLSTLFLGCMLFTVVPSVTLGRSVPTPVPTPMPVMRATIGTQDPYASITKEDILKTLEHIKQLSADQDTKADQGKEENKQLNIDLRKSLIETGALQQNVNTLERRHAKDATTIHKYHRLKFWCALLVAGFIGLAGSVIVSSISKYIPPPFNAYLWAVPAIGAGVGFLLTEALV